MPPDPDSESARRARRRADARFRRRRRTALVIAVVVAAVLGLTAGILAGGGSDGADPAPAPPPDPLAALTAGELAGQRLVAGFDGTEPPKGLLRMLADGGLAGVILFEDNFTGDRADTRMTAELQRAAGRAPLDAPLLVMTDQEGGQVKRLPGPPSASAAEMAQRGPGYAREQGRATAKSLLGAGVNVDLAPVLDLARPGAAIAAEERSFGARPEEVIATGVDGFAAGLRDGGVAAAAKHFPGLGGAATNTDFAAQAIDLPAAALRNADMAPFAAFAEGGGELVMLGLATYPALSRRPAALAPEIATGELRGRLGFTGVSITDSLDATAAQAWGDRDEVALAAAGAGSDLLLYGDWRTASAAGDALVRALRRGRLDRAAFESSAERVAALRGSLG
ncbi:MAG: glycoside hydrolase family 3 N-terminal domain-containing protein [Solirubrobacterales bacterium]